MNRLLKWFVCGCLLVRASVPLGVDLLPTNSFGAEPVTEARLAVLPKVDLKRLDPQVAQQMESVQSLLVEVTSRRDATKPQLAEAYGEFGRVLLAYGYANEAVPCFQQCTTLQPDTGRWWHYLGYSLESAGQLAEAVTAYRRAIQLDNLTATRLRLGNVLVQLNRHDEAQPLFTDLLSENPNLPAAHAGVGMLALERRDHPKAIEHLSRALKLVPAATRLHYSLAMAYREKGDLESARRHLQLRGGVGIRPDDPLVDELPQLLRGAQVHQLRGRIALAAGALSDAAREFQLCLKADPDNVTAHVNLAVTLVRMNEPTEAERHLELALKRQPQNSSALFNLADLRHRQGDFAKAAELLRRLQEVDPRDLAARLLLAKSLTELQRTTEAIDLLREGLKQSPTDEPTILLLAELLFRDRQYAASLKVLKESFARHPDRGLTAHALARQLACVPEESLRDGAVAVQLAEKVLTARPGFERTETLAMALAAANRFDEAIAVQKRLLDAAEKQNAPQLATRVRDNLIRYQQHRPALGP